VSALANAEVRYREDVAGITAFSVAGGLAVTAAILAIVYRRDISGATREERAAPKRASLMPAGLGGPMVSW
jgi:hypothetical protein